MKYDKYKVPPKFSVSRSDETENFVRLQIDGAFKMKDLQELYDLGLRLIFAQHLGNAGITELVLEKF